MTSNTAIRCAGCGQPPTPDILPHLGDLSAGDEWWCINCADTITNDDGDDDDDDDYSDCADPGDYDGGFGRGSYFDHAMSKDD